MRGTAILPETFDPPAACLMLVRQTPAGWQAISDFVQMEPVEGAPASQKTEVWVLFDHANVYICARLWEDHPVEEVALALWIIGVQPAPPLDLPDLHDQAQALGEELDDFPIDLVDGVPQLGDFGQHPAMLVGRVGDQQLGCFALQGAPPK